MRNKHFPEYPRVKRPPEQKKGRFQSFEKVYRCTPFSDTNLLFFFSGIFWDILAYFFLSKWPFSEAFCRRQWIRTLRTDEIPRQPCIDIIDVLSQSSTITCQYKGYIEGNPRCIEVKLFDTSQFFTKLYKKHQNTYIPWLFLRNLHTCNQTSTACSVHGDISFYPRRPGLKGESVLERIQRWPEKPKDRPAARLVGVGEL